MQISDFLHLILGSYKVVKDVDTTQYTFSNYHFLIPYMTGHPNFGAIQISVQLFHLTVFHSVADFIKLFQVS